jgi:hypothetical protein
MLGCKGFSRIDSNLLSSIAKFIAQGGYRKIFIIRFDTADAPFDKVSCVMMFSGFAGHPTKGHPDHFVASIFEDEMREEARIKLGLCSLLRLCRIYR